MAKFNMDRLRGIHHEDKGDMARRETIGQGLLNDASRALRMDTMRVKYIPVDQIRKNESNFYSVGDITQLKQSIETIGLKQPLVVHRQADGTYMLIGGERRLTAIEELIKEEKWQDPVVPCVLQEYSRIELPLSDELKEMYCIITTNREQRDYTDADLANEIRCLREIYENLRKSGVKSFSIGLDVNGNEQFRDLKGSRTRDLIAKDLDISTGKVAAFDKVEKYGSAELKKALEKNEISITRAAQISDLPEQEQKAAVKEEIEKRKQRKSRAGREVQVKADRISEDLSRLLAFIGQEKILVMSGKEYDRYISSVKAIEKILENRG